jgi:hypothetical protein
MEVGIHPYLIADDGLGTMAGIDSGLCGEVGNDSRKTVD